MKKIIPFLFLLACSAPQQKDEKGILAINGTRLFYHAFGMGEPVIVIHGGPVLDQSYMVDHFKELSKKYRLIFMTSVPAASRRQM